MVKFLFQLSASVYFAACCLIYKNFSVTRDVGVQVSARVDNQRL